MNALFLTLFLLVGGAFIAMGVPLMKRSVKPNRWYGFRIRRTLEDPDVWYAVNEFGGKRFLWVGVAVIIAAVILYFVPDISIAAYSYLVLAVAVVGLIITIVQTLSFLGRLPKKQFADDDPKA